MSTTLIVRRAQADDSRDLWLWRNDDETRRNSKSTDPVPWADHQRWFAGVLGDDARRIYIALLGDDKIGTARFEAMDGAPGHWLVSIALAPDARGRGLGGRLLATACAQIAVDCDVCALDAEIRYENIASQRIFAACGFELVGPSETAGLQLFRRLSEDDGARP